MRKQRPFLRNIADPSLVGGDKYTVGKQRLTVHNDPPAIGRFETGENAQQRGFSRARRTNNGRPAPRRHGQIEIIENQRIGEGFRNRRQFQHVTTLPFFSTAYKEPRSAAAK